MRESLLRTLLGVCLISTVALAACSMETDAQEGRATEMEASGKVREPAVAGAFYPGTETALRSAVTTMLDEAEPPALEGKVLGLISPHAGYMYSGAVAAHAYKLIEGSKFDAVILVAPSHHLFFPGSSIYRQGPYRTPLGLVEVDVDLAEAMASAEPSITFKPEAHIREHSLEVQLPFLQVAVPDLKIVPIVMADQSYENCVRLAAAIAGAVRGKEVLLVASSDLSHFHAYDEAVAMDQVIIDDVLNYDCESIARDLGTRKTEACGGGPMIAVMLAAKHLGATRAIKLAYANSGDVTGDKSEVVGYLSAAIVAGPGQAEESPGREEELGRQRAEQHVGVDLGLKEEEKAELLRLARKSIEARLGDQDPPVLSAETLDGHPILRQERGAFVTLTIGGRLRGCIGNIRGSAPLDRTISRMAVSAATEDPRFPALKAGELDKVAIEISVLTPLEKISDPEEIEVGRDGLYLEKGANRGLLLPQVATEYGWDRYHFLDQTCLKAGLPAGSWKEGADIYIFSAQIFNEEEIFGGSASR
jgi:AmmeMemoRadiSam system protein B/AmmeMemoRadiSam system protein A